jgi:hypothetical protein
MFLERREVALPDNISGADDTDSEFVIVFLRHLKG